MSRIIFNPSTGNIEPVDNVTSPFKTLGEKLKLTGGNPLPEDPTKPVNPWAPKPIGPVLPNKQLAELTNMNTPDLEQSPDSFLRPGETLEDWDVTFRRANAKGGSVKPQRRLKAAGPLLLAPALLPYAAAFIGTTATGLMAQKKIQNYFENNPDAMPKFKEWVSNFIPGIHGPKDKDLEDLEKIKIESFPKEDWSKSFGDNEGTKIPEPEKQKPPVSGGKIDIPLTTGGSKIPELKKEDLIFTSQTAEDVDGEEVISKEEIKETFDKSKILYDQKKMTEVKELTNKEFAEKVANFIDTKHGGRLEAAVKDILGVTEKTKDVDNLRQRINSLFKNRGIERGIRTGNIAPPSNIDITYDEKVTWSDLTTNISKDKNYLRRKIKKFIKEGKLDPNKYYTLQQLADAFGIEFKDKSQSNNMGYILSNKLKGEIRTTKTGKYPYYHLGDTLKALQNRFKDKKIPGKVKKGSEKYAFNKSFDPELSLELVNLQDRIANLSKNADIYDDEAIPHWQHAESRDNMGKYPNVFRDSNLKTLQTATLGHPGVNVDLMTKKGYEAKKGSIYKELEKLIGKKANKENIETWKKLSERMNDVYIDFFEEIEKKKNDPEVGDSYIGAEKTVVPIKIKVPEIGEKFRSEHIYGDMSNVEEIMGDIQDINPYAKKLSDLSQEEKDLWRKTVINQYLDHLTDFYKNAGYDDEDLETFEDWIYEGDPSGQTLSLEERKNKAIGGPVVPTIPYRENFADGTAHDDKSDEEILEWIKNQMFEMEQGWNTGKSIPGKILDVARVDNWPYYAARMLRAGMNVAEVSAKLPFVSIDLLQKLATRPAFKLVDAKTSTGDPLNKSVVEMGMGEKYMQGFDDSWLTDQPQKKLKGTGLFTESFKDLMPGAFSEKTGLDSLIEGMEEKMIAQGQSKWPTIAGKNIEMGLDITLPFGYVMAANKYNALKKSLAPFVAGKSPSKVIEEALTEKGMNRRDFNKLLVTGGAIGALKYLGLDKLLKGVARNPIPGPIKMIERSTTKMPVWFPKFIDKINDKMTYHGDGMWSFTGTDDFLPGFHIERIGDDYHISGKNAYEQDFQITYESPKWEGDADGSYYNSGEFIVEDSVPMRTGPDDADFDGEVVEELHNVLGGTKELEEIGTGQKVKEMTKGERQVDWAEGRAQSAWDEARDAGEFDVE